MKNFMIILALVGFAFCAGWLLCQQIAGIGHRQRLPGARIADLQARLLPLEREHQAHEYRGKIWEKIKSGLGLAKLIK